MKQPTSSVILGVGQDFPPTTSTSVNTIPGFHGVQDVFSRQTIFSGAQGGTYSALIS